MRMHHVLLLALAAGVAVSGCKKKEEAPTPVGVTPIPGPGALGMPGMPREQLIAAGTPVFVANCAKCHGENGTGVWNETLFDEDGLPSPARNLVDEPFKGGHEPAAVYLRIFAGMPGTPHPSCMTVSEEQLVDRVEYCRSLAREPKRASTNNDRSNHAARRTIPGGLPAIPGAGEPMSKAIPFPA